MISVTSEPAATTKLDLSRLELEMERYHDWMDEKADIAYRIAEKARSRGFDHKTVVEIPRASDLAGRTEKLLVEHLEGMEIADEIRKALAEHNREVSAIMMAQQTARRFREAGWDLQKSIDVGLRVGLAILTEAVLVAPLEGISEVRLLNNTDGSPFLSIHFAGPIRAAGGTAQALAVLIADMIRIDLGIDRYSPTTPEVERVKEEFGLYRGNLQYRPTPEEIDVIVRACPVMINGESTEEIECAGFGNVRNIDEARIRGGVLLVIGEGLCLKAPKIRKHTETLNVPGWGFISEFANKGSMDSSNNDEEKFISNRVKPNQAFMKDIIAGRPVFGQPMKPGGFRLRYGRPRTSGLAAASCNPASMFAMDDFITIGTQMKIERPGKACAITPCDVAQGPWVILSDGAFLRIDALEEMIELRPNVKSIWDNGELVIGFGEFRENNKKLVPAAYNGDWWAADILETVVSEKEIAEIKSIIGKQCPEWPSGSLLSSDELEVHSWIRHLSSLKLDWESVKQISLKFGTSLPSPHNPWWLDMPIEWLNSFVKSILNSKIEHGKMRIIGGCENWSSAIMDELIPEVIDLTTIPGPKYVLDDPIFSDEIPWAWVIKQHGIVKAGLLQLGIAHHHEGNDIVVSEGWEALLEGLGLGISDEIVIDQNDIQSHIDKRIENLREANHVLSQERSRIAVLESERSKVRIAAETDARQRGLGIAETDKIGQDAADEVVDTGPEDPRAFLAAQRLEDEHAIDGILFLVRNMSSLRWEHSAPVRIGARMGRPEKAAPREMKPAVHALFPIALTGGNQRLLENSAQQHEIRVQVGRRTCKKCGIQTPFIRCINRPLPGSDYCNARTEEIKVNSKRRRMGEIQTIRMDEMLDTARDKLGIDRIPQAVKCVKGLMSRSQTPEAIEKGILRAKRKLPVFRDGTIRYDMSDVPITHFRPNEISTDWKVLKELGYTHDIFGDELANNDQLLEIYPQDFIIAKGATDYLVRSAQFIDELLERFYGMEAFYLVERAEDLVGCQIVALAPHTSGGVLSRIIGWSDSSGGYAHPMFHAAKRRNCDGDEDAIMLLMDGLLNFSRDILPANRGGQMDAPLVLTTRLNPTEVDKEALNVDAAWFYRREFYEATLSQTHPQDIVEKMGLVEGRLGSVAAVRGYGFTHDTRALDIGPSLSAYKTLETMIDKMEGQLSLGRRLRGVDVREVASSVIRSHFLPDLRGNLVAFTRQKVRCLKCGHSYRRMPIAGKCIQARRSSGRGLASHGVRKRENDRCNGNLALTVTQGAVRKYIEVTRHVMETYGVDGYTRQNMEWLADSVESLFNNDKAKQMSLSDFF